MNNLHKAFVLILLLLGAGPTRAKAEELCPGETEEWTASTGWELAAALEERAGPPLVAQHLVAWDLGSCQVALVHWGKQAWIRNLSGLEFTTLQNLLTPTTACPDALLGTAAGVLLKQPRAKEFRSFLNLVLGEAQTTYYQWYWQSQSCVVTLVRHEHTESRRLRLRPLMPRHQEAASIAVGSCWSCYDAFREAWLQGCDAGPYTKAALDAGGACLDSEGQTAEEKCCPVSGS